MGIGVATLFLACPVVAVAQDDAARIGITTAAAPGGVLEALLFYAIAGGAVISALAICFTKNIVRMAVWLLVALGSVSLLYFSLAANFLAAIQLMVYAGGTLVLLVFGVMLTSKSPWARFEASRLETIGALVVCSALTISLAMLLTRVPWAQASGAVSGTSVADLGRSLLTTYLVPFEMAGVLLMIVMVGAAYLARQDK